MLWHLGGGWFYPPPEISRSVCLIGLKFSLVVKDDNSSSKMQFYGYIFLPRNSRGVKVRAKGPYIAKIWPKSAKWPKFSTFSKIRRGS